MRTRKARLRPRFNVKSPAGRSRRLATGGVVEVSFDVARGWGADENRLFDEVLRLMIDGSRAGVPMGIVIGEPSTKPEDELWEEVRRGIITALEPES